MKKIQRLFSLLQKLPRMSNYLGIELRVMRDDLFPITGGGNKARKIVKIIQDAEKQSCNALVTTGGIQSNHARVTALAAAQKGWGCKLILHGDKEKLVDPQGNLLLMLLTGAEVQVVESSKISPAMSLAIDAFRSEGLIPYEIHGGGHSLSGSMAFVDATKELQEYCQKDGWRPDWLIHASGTGTTQAGLIAGLEKLGWHTKVIGISIARRNPRGKDIVKKSYLEISSYLGLPSRNKPIDFRDNWVGQGYEKADSKVISAITTAAEIEGLILDSTYTGKAFAALLDLVSDGEIPQKSNVLFWHTGGLINLMASDYIFYGF